MYHNRSEIVVARAFVVVIPAAAALAIVVSEELFICIAMGLGIINTTEVS